MCELRIENWELKNENEKLSDGYETRGAGGDWWARRKWLSAAGWLVQWSPDYKQPTIPYSILWWLKCQISGLENLFVGNSIS